MARSFNGSTDQIATPSFAIPAAGTLACWVNPGTLSNAYNGILVHANGATLFFEILLKSTAHFAYYIREAGGSVISVDPGTAAISGNTHVALIYDLTVGLKSFVNGGNDGTAAPTGNAINSGSALLGIGYDPVNAGRNYPGSIADAAEWNVALTAAEISALAKGVRPYMIRPAALIGYWPLDGFSSPEPDLSGNGRAGTLTGTAFAAGPPITMFTPRWRQLVLPTSAPSAVSFRKSASRIGTRTGSRQTWAA